MNKIFLRREIDTIAYDHGKDTDYCYIHDTRAMLSSFFAQLKII